MTQDKPIDIPSRLGTLGLAKEGLFFGISLGRLKTVAELVTGGRKSQDIVVQVPGELKTWRLRTPYLVLAKRGLTIDSLTLASLG